MIVTKKNYIEVECTLPFSGSVVTGKGSTEKEAIEDLTVCLMRELSFWEEKKKAIFKELQIYTSRDNKQILDCSSHIVELSDSISSLGK